MTAWQIENLQELCSLKANIPRGRHCWSFMERNQGTGCILSASSDRTTEGVITHDCMANWKKFAGIVFSELFKGNPPTIYLKPAKLPTVLVLNLYVNAFVHIVGIALILLITYHKNSFIT